MPPNADVSRRKRRAGRRINNAPFNLKGLCLPTGSQWEQHKGKEQKRQIYSVWHV